jgi:FtsH-binding integral membrane protein
LRPTYQQHSPHPEADHRVTADSIAVRAKFIERTYLHLAGAIAAFVGLEYAFLHSEPMFRFALSIWSFGPWVALAIFIGVSFLADWWARHTTSRPMQYLGLAVYVVLQAMLVLPLMLRAAMVAGPEVFMTAGVSTLAIFSALTGIVLVTKRDFSWLRGVIILASFVAFGLLIASMIFGLGLSMSLGMTVFLIFLAAAWILYDTSNIMRYYHPESYVSAALALFASVVLLFMQLLKLFSRE